MTSVHKHMVSSGSSGVSELSFVKKEQLRGYASKLNFFHQVPSQLEKVLVNEAKLLKFSMDSTLFREGDTADCMYIILTGAVVLFSTKKQGKNHASNDVFGEYVCTLHVGDSIGSQSLAGPRLRSATAVCLEDVEVAVLYRDHYNITIERFHCESKRALTCLPQIELEEKLVLDYDQQVQPWAPLSPQTHQQLQSTLVKLPKHRSKKEVEATVDILLHTELFQRMSPCMKYVRKLCRGMEYQRLDYGQVLFTQGEIVTDTSCMYVVVSGSLAVHRNRDKSPVSPKVKFVLKYFSVLRFFVSIFIFFFSRFPHVLLYCSSLPPLPSPSLWLLLLSSCSTYTATTFSTEQVYP